MMDGTPVAPRSVSISKEPARIAGMFDAIAGRYDARDGRSMNGFSRFWSKTGVMPRTANGRSIEQAFSKRAPIVRALGSHGMHGRALAHQQHRFSVEVTEEHAPVAEFARCRSICS